MDNFRVIIKRKAMELDDESTLGKSPAVKSSAPPRQQYSQPRRPAKTTTFHLNEQQSGCKVCGDFYHHFLYQCPDFKGQTVDQRQATVQRLKMCTNCLGSDHAARNCPSRRSCRVCARRHNTLLHRNKTPPSQQHTSPAVPPTQQPATLVSTMDSVCNTVSSSTAMILGTCVAVIESKGRQQKTRALMDNGSCLTFVTSRLVSSLKMHKISEPIAVTGFQQTATSLSKFEVNFHLRIPSGTVTTFIPIQAVVVDVITGDLPSSSLTAVRQDPYLDGLQLADPGFDKPGRIDLLLGVNVLPRVMLEGIVHSSDYSMNATRSVYGWVVTGTCKSSVQVPRSHLCLKTTPLDQQTQDLLTRFWQVEDVSSSSTIRTEEEQAALEHFNSTHSRQAVGRYVVELPRKSTTLSLGCSKEQAVRRSIRTRSP